MGLFLHPNWGNTSNKGAMLNTHKVFSDMEIKGLYYNPYLTHNFKLNACKKNLLKDRKKCAESNTVYSFKYFSSSRQNYH